MSRLEGIKEWILDHKKLSVALLLIFVVLFARSRQAASKTTTPSSSVKQTDIKETLTLSGSIAADERTVLTFQTSGQLVSVAVKEGDFVKKGQFIAAIDQRELRKRLQKQLNTYASTRLDFDQTKADYKDVALTDAISRIQGKSQYTLDNAVIDVEINDIAIRYANLYSPISGIVTSVSTPIAGVNITPATAQFEIINPNSMYFSSTADQSEVVQLQIGKSAQIDLDPFTDSPIKSTISSIAFVPKSGETSTVYTVKLPFSGKWNERYRIGMTGDAEFVLREKKGALVVPAGYIKEDDTGKKYVWVRKEGKTVRRFVNTGIEGDDSIEITAGLKANENVYDLAQ